MAQKVQVLVTCDLHEDDTEGVETVQFGVDGYSYEIDLCADHSEQVHDQLQDMISHARPVSGGRGRRRPAPSRRRADRTTTATPEPPAVSDRERLQAIREWARSNGHPDLGSRGRIPRAIVEEYEAAHR